MQLLWDDAKFQHLNYYYYNLEASGGTLELFMVKKV
jgi:hypothetical protein